MHLYDMIDVDLHVVERPMVGNRHGQRFPNTSKKDREISLLHILLRFRGVVFRTYGNEIHPARVLNI